MYLCCSSGYVNFACIHEKIYYNQNILLIWETKPYNERKLALKSNCDVVSSLSSSNELPDAVAPGVPDDSVASVAIESFFLGALGG